MKLCRVLMHGMRGGGNGTPRAALVNSIREQYKHRKKWRASVARQPGETWDGLGAYTLAELRVMAEEGRSPAANKKGVCRPWVPSDRWSKPQEDDCLDTPEAHYFRFISGIVDTIEESDRLEDYNITPTHGKAAPKGSPYRNAVVALACSIL